MYCEECGHKNDEKNSFCEECGTKLKKTVVKKTAKSKPMDKKSKMKLIVAAVIVVAFIACYKILDNITSPEKVATEYFDAIINRDYDKVYDLLDYDNSSELLTKEIFKSLSEENVSDSTVEVKNYSVSDVTTSSDGLTTSVKFSYITADSSSKTETISLTKEKGKKYLLFDNWVISDKSNTTISDSKVKVLKGSKLTIEGVEISSEFLSKDDCTEKYDVYKLPEMFNSKYDVTVKFPKGFSLSTTFRPSTYSKNNAQALSFSLSNLSDETKTSIENSIKNYLNTIYKDAIDKKSYNDIKSNFEYDGSLDDLEKAYSDLSDIISGNTYSVLKEFNVDSVDISSVSVSDQTGYLVVIFKYSYSYKTDLKSGSGYTEKSSTNTRYSATMDFGYTNDYKLVNFINLSSYFY